MTSARALKSIATRALPGRAARAGAAALALALAASGCARPRADEAPPRAVPESARTLPAGPVVGREGRYGGHAWLGLPYARPPVGPLRWRAPEPAPRWSETREALRPGSPCVQLASALGGAEGARDGEPTGSEDCLVLNVYAPRFAPDEVPQGDARLPVMLWIHGGGNSIGEAGFYDGSRLASEGRVVVVTTNYRLGPFGWFRHEAVSGPGASEGDRSGNFGTLDLVAALRFLRENVAAFGGDPGNVTIFGESAGGANVVSLLVSPRAAGLFHRAIVQSGGTFSYDAVEAEARADAGGHRWSSREAVASMLARAGLAADRAAGHARAEATAPAELAGWLRERPAFDVLTAYEDAFGGMIQLPDIIRDGAVIPVEPALEVLASGRAAPVPVVLGTNRDEVKLFMALDPEQVWSLWFLRFVRDRDRYERDAAYGSRAWKASGADEPATALAAAGRTPAFVYRFDWDELPTVLGLDLARLLGAAHGFEIPFVFGHFHLGRLGARLFSEETEASRQALSAALRSYWTEFAYAGAPGDAGAPASSPRGPPGARAGARRSCSIRRRAAASGSTGRASPAPLSRGRSSPTRASGTRPRAARPSAASRAARRPSARSSTPRSPAAPASRGWSSRPDPNHGFTGQSVVRAARGWEDAAGERDRAGAQDAGDALVPPDAGHALHGLRAVAGYASTREEGLDGGSSEGRLRVASSIPRRSGPHCACAHRRSAGACGTGSSRSRGRLPIDEFSTFENFVLDFHGPIYTPRRV